MEFPRERGFAVVGVLVGAAFVAFGIFMLVREAPPETPSLTAPALIAIVGGALAFAFNARALWARVRLRASPEGLWFGGGRTLPWRHVRAIYAYIAPPDRQRSGCSPLARRSRWSCGTTTATTSTWWRHGSR